MKYILALALVLVCLGHAAAKTTPTPYYSLNPYDDVMLGSGITEQNHGHYLEALAGYSFAQEEIRGRFRYRNDRGISRRIGYALQAYHDVQPLSDLVPMFHTGFYEGRTGGSLTAFQRLGYHEVAAMSLIADKVWELPARTNLLPTGSDRIHAVQLSYRRDTRDDPYNPRGGMRAEVSATQAVRVFGGTRAFLLARGTLSRYQELGEKGTLAWRLNAAATSGKLPEQRRLWLPGEGVRGYDFATNVGTLAGVANAEVRLPLLARENLSLGPLGTLMRLQVTGFADIGEYRAPSGSWFFRGCVGAGLRAPMVAFGQVPMVLRLDAAQGLTPGGEWKSYLLLTAPELF